MFTTTIKKFGGIALAALVVFVVFSGMLPNAKNNSQSAAVFASRAGCGTLASGESLTPGQSIVSCSGSYTLVFQTDGNVVLYGPGGALWATNTVGQGATVFAMQTDGNLVLYNGSTPLWASSLQGGTYGRAAHLSVQDDGNLVVYADGNREVFWASNSNSTVSVYPTELATAFRNPGMGWVPYSFQPILPGDGPSTITNISVWNTDLASEIYTNYFPMGDLNPSPGAYRFDLIDRLIFKAQEKNQKAYISIVTTSPNSIPNAGFTGAGITPSWFINMHPTAATCLSNVFGAALNSLSAPCFWEPYYWDGNFLQMHQDFFTALANRYNNPSAAGYAGAPDWKQTLAGFEISTYGYWGEWHSPLAFGADKGATLQRMIDDNFGAFVAAPRNFQISISGVLTANGYTTGSPSAGGSNDPARIAYAVQKGAGIVRKFVGQYSDPDLNGLPPYVTTNPYFTEIDKQYLLSAVQTVPFRGEWGSFDGTFPFTDPNAGNVVTGNLETAIKQALELHASELGWFTPALSSMKESTTGETLEVYFQKRAGYRLVAREIQYPSVIALGGTFQLSIKWSQLGVAKLYKQYYLVAYLYKDGILTPLNVDQANWPSFDAHLWPLGPQNNRWTQTTFTIPASVAAGIYELRFAIVDDAGNPALNLAITGKDETSPTKYGRYTIGSVTIGSVTVAAPTVLLDANGQSSLTIYAGDNYALNWNSTNSAGCTMAYSRTDGYEPKDGYFYVTPNAAGSGTTGMLGTYTLTCVDNSSKSATASVVITEIQATALIQGYKVASDNSESIKNQLVSVASISSDAKNPYGFTLDAGKSYTVSVPSVGGYSTGYTLCIDSTTCHQGTPTPGTSATVTIPAGPNHFADLWWHYTLIHRDPHTITATLTANGAGETTVSPGEYITLKWSSTNAASATATVAPDSPDTCKTKLALSVTKGSGSYKLGPIGACRAGHTYAITYTVTDSAGQQASASAIVHVRATSASAPPS